jgi:hypothetical protein
MAKAYPANHRKPWTEAQLTFLRLAVAKGIYLEGIMGKAQRTAGAILSKLVELQILRPNRHKQAFTLKGKVYCTYEERKRLMP